MSHISVSAQVKTSFASARARARLAIMVDLFQPDVVVLDGDDADDKCEVGEGADGGGRADDGYVLNTDDQPIFYVNSKKEQTDAKEQMLNVGKVKAGEIVPCLCCKKSCLPPEPLCHDHLIAKSFLAMIGVTNDCYDTVTHRQKIMSWIEMLPVIFKPIDLDDRVRFLATGWRKYRDKRETLARMKDVLNEYQVDHKLVVQERDNLLFQMKKLEKDLAAAKTKIDELEKELEVVSKARDNYIELTTTANKSIEVLMNHIAASQGSSETEVRNIGSQSSSQTEDLCDPAYCAWNTDAASVQSTAHEPSRNSRKRKDIDCLSCVFVPCVKHRVFTGTLAVCSGEGVQADLGGNESEAAKAVP